jgi:hypothetical protein
METVKSVLESPQFWGILLLISEALGMNPKVKANSIFQFVVQLITAKQKR